MTGAILTAVITLAVINLAFKGVGPALLGDREFPARVQAVITALPAVLLAGLVLRAVRQSSHLLCLAVAMLVTAGLRALVG